MKPELQQADLNDLHNILIEADKVLFIAFRNGQITLD